MNTKKTKYTVIGAGNGGKAMAAYMALKGFSVTLYNRTPEHVEAIKKRGGITLEGQDIDAKGFGELAYVTSDIQEALRRSRVVMVVVPATAHADVARIAAPHLQDGQIVILNPGRTLGSLEFRKVLRDTGCKAKVVVAEAQTFVYASRSDGPAQARVFRVKDAVPLAALPASDTPKALKAVKPVYPQFIDGGHVLDVGVNNIGAIFHPTIMLCNVGWTEGTGGSFEFYLDGVTPTVARIMEAIDRERVKVGEALGAKVISAREWLNLAYNSRGENLYETIHNQPGYRGINAPPTMQHRYITEDVPMSLVPLAALGRRFGIPVRGMESLIRLAIIAHGTDYWARGRTPEKLGIEDLSVEQLQRYVREGDIDGEPASTTSGEK